MRRYYVFTAAVVTFALGCTLAALAGIHPAPGLALPPAPPAVVALSCEAVYILDGATLCVPRPHVAGAAEPHSVPLSVLSAPGVVRVYSED